MNPYLKVILKNQNLINKINLFKLVLYRTLNKNIKDNFIKNNKNIKDSKIKDMIMDISKIANIVHNIMINIQNNNINLNIFNLNIKLIK